MGGRSSALAVRHGGTPDFRGPLGNQSSTRGEFHSHAMSPRPADVSRTRHKSMTTPTGESPHAQSDKPPLGFPLFLLTLPSPRVPERESTPRAKRGNNFTRKQASACVNTLASSAMRFSSILSMAASTDASGTATGKTLIRAVCWPRLPAKLRTSRKATACKPQCENARKSH